MDSVAQGIRERGADPPAREWSWQPGREMIKSRRTAERALGPGLALNPFCHPKHVLRLPGVGLHCFVLLPLSLLPISLCSL